MKKLLVSLMLIISSVVVAQQTAGTLDPSQIYTTGNIVQPTVAGTNTTPWINGVYQDQLTCFAWGNPGYCGPNAIVRPGNNINFSYGLTDLYQVQSIASVLPNSGTGLRVNGYNFGFMAKNGNGWDDGRQDTLSAYVTFYGSDGKVKDHTYYDLNSKFDWATFNYTKDLVTPYATKDLSTVQYGFIGMDNNFWAGPYGPEITNVSFSLKYSVDPCYTNVLSSPTCPGYMDALNKLLPPPPTIDPTSTTSTTTTATTTVTTTVTADPIAPTVTVVSVPVASSTSTTSNSSSNSSANTSTSSPIATVTKEGEPTQSSSSGTSLGLSVISKNKEREQSIVTQTVQNAISTATTAAANSQQEALSVAAQAASNSTTFASVTNTSQSSGTGIRLSGSGQSIVSILGMTNDSMNGPMNTNSQQTNIAGVNNGISSQEVKQVILTINPQTSVITSIITESQTLNPTDFTTNRTNPINEYIEAKQVVPQTNITTTIGSIVNRSVADNDVAGGVSITRMAVAPTGYADYLNLTLRDASFYAPKEVYKNQRNVDNARALRSLTNDSKHQEMVEQQYRR